MSDQKEERLIKYVVVPLTIFLLAVVLFALIQPGHVDYGPVLHDTAGHACYKDDLVQDARGFHCVRTVDSYR